MKFLNSISRFFAQFFFLTAKKFTAIFCYTGSYPLYLDKIIHLFY